MKANEIYMYVLGSLIVLCFFAVIGILIFKEMPQQNSEILYLAVGALIGYAGSVKDYFFGSSKGSADKTQLLNK
jgi:hypothetical protein